MQPAGITGEFFPNASNKILSVFEITTTSSFAAAIRTGGLCEDTALGFGPSVDAAEEMNDRIVDICVYVLQGKFLQVI